MRDANEVSRAEIVRRRRRNRSQTGATQLPLLPMVATRPIAPITARRSTTDPAPQRITPAKTNRQYQAALAMPGIELRMPVIHFTSRSIKWRLFSLTMSLVLGAGLYFAWTSPLFVSAVPELVGNTRIGPEQINPVLAVEGHLVFTLVPSDLETHLRLNYPEVLSARISLGLPNQVTVHVVERTPLISWQEGDGVTWIDESGVAFRPRGTADDLIAVTASAKPSPGLPSGNDPLSPIPYISTDLLGAIKTLAPSVPQGTSLIYDPQFGLGWSDSRGWKVFFGSDSGGMAVKLEVYQALLKTLAGKGITPSFISVQYANAPFYRTSQ